ncbi:MAG: hypothetical protein LBV60_21290 [Streptomyces sp.]|jgi:hypothetical protein|nr:hypothetical protein [Streptomyces sp.]
MTSLNVFRAAQSGGDLPPTAVREKRCLKSPFSCGQPLTPTVFAARDEAALYEVEWRITGLCPDCQDRVHEGGEPNAAGL